MSNNFRVRFAPSPTGEPHVGNIRTAIFDWLLAKRHGGEFIVRIEDTDRARAVDGAVEVIIEALKWLGLRLKYAPYKQSERLALYSEHAERLVEAGFAYKCYCSPERLDAVRKSRSKQDNATGYDRRCRDLSQDERAERPVVRFRMPLEGTTTVDDLVRGEVTFENRLVDDFVMLKSDGFPTYHLAHLIDDHEMQITHVLRGEEWLPSVPRHLQLYEALGWKPPLFAHLPIILAPDRSKLSKRHGATSLLDYREMGYLPHTMVNFLTLLGWSLDDKTELFTLDSLIENFSIGRVSKAGAIFNTEKLDWMNGHYIREMSADELADTLLDFWQAFPPLEIPTLPSRELALKIVPWFRSA
ncbi:Glutamate--tRNA ligase [Geodia barretti]|uniref:Nondiscriminating glutamyl-tRNA synthetase EARS2, mitochondrial n=1 Tax=Geodia barretti TaxID=519541 RepID=A0AA35RQA0_GEOBA|nr:Glutamate--tRNA ligase [Geodia barretti]